MLKYLNTRIKQIAVLLAVLAALAIGVSLRAGQSGLLGKQELKELVANAKTAGDHHRLAQHFAAKAEQLEAEGKEHDELAEQYKKNPTMHESKHPMSGQTAGHCQYFANELHKAAQEARKLAADHEEMAEEAKK